MLEARVNDLSMTEKEFSFLVKENQMKEEYLTKKIFEVETLLKEFEIKNEEKTSDKFIKHLSLKFFHKDLKEIDELLIKADYLDHKASNLVMDECEERINRLLKKLKNL